MDTHMIASCPRPREAAIILDRLQRLGVDRQDISVLSLPPDEDAPAEPVVSRPDAPAVL